MVCSVCFLIRCSFMALLQMANDYLIMLFCCYFEMNYNDNDNDNE